MMLTSNRGNFSPTFFFTFVAAYYKYITFNEFFSRGSLKVILNPDIFLFHSRVNPFLIRKKQS